MKKFQFVKSLSDIITKTDYPTPDRIRYIAKTALPELASDGWKEGEWEVDDCEGELENWCSG